MKKWILVAAVLLGCRRPAPEPAPPPPESDHLLEQVKQLGAELLACRKAENERLQRESDALGVEIEKTKREIAAYVRLLGADAGVP